MEKNNRVAVVTGASSGIGASIAYALAENGYTVVGLARRVNKIALLAKKTRGEIIAKPCDVTIEEEIERAFNWIDTSFERIDILVNCAGVFKIGGVTTGKVEDWKTLFDVNVTGLSLCCRLGVITMRKSNDNGHIININSLLGHTVPQSFDCGMYSATKYAVTAITESLKNDLRRAESSIRVTSISPGSVYTELSQRVTAEIQGIEFNDRIVLGDLPKRFLHPADIAETVMYIISTPPHVQINEITIEAADQERA